jgi:uncharacterized protein YfaS (alpha-2-macroglobulin family)
VKDDAFGVRAGIDNQTSEALRVKVALTVENLTGDSTVKDLRLSAGASGSVDWMLSAPAFGKGRMQLTAQSGERQDGMEVTIPIQDKGVPISVWSSGSLGAAEKTTSASVDVPQDGIPGSSSLEITASTSLIGTILDALPFLMDSQSVRVEGIVSRFLPAAATLRTLQVLGASPEQTAERIFSTSRNPLGGREALSKVEDGVKQGLQQVYDRQNSDGSWSWWRGGDADPYMTDYILWGLRIAQASGVGVREDKLDAAAKYLRDTLIGTANQPDLQAWILHALTAGRPAQKRAAPEETAAMNLLWENRDALSPYGRAVYALALFRAGQTQRATTLARNMRDGAARETDAVPNRAETVFWRATGGYPGKFSSNIEATAFAVEALQAIDPKSELIQPALRWLMINRRGAAWSNSRDSAIVVLALNGSIAADAQADSTYEVTVNGERIAEVRGQGLLPQAGSFTVGSDKLKQGANEVRIRRTGGDGPIFFTTSLRYVSVADSLEPEASSLGIRREYLRYAAHETLLDGYRYEKSPWPEETSVPVNMRTETVLTLKASTDLAYIRVRDRFPAGLEPSISVSGPSFMATNEAGETLPVYVQVRDDSLDMFIENLPQGEWLIRYDMRTAFSGNFAARPATIEGVYAPDFSGSSSSRRIKIEP